MNGNNRIIRICLLKSGVFNGKRQQPLPEQDNETEG
jgi:hypothetical protein